MKERRFLRESDSIKEVLKHLFGRQGFTLLEILVSVSIIGLVLSILVPSLGRIREQSKRVLCRTHLRNVCIGALTYANDNDSYLPVDDMLGPSYRDVEVCHKALFTALENYVVEPQNYFCPSETDPELQYSQENFDSGVMGYYYYSCSRATGNRDISTFLRWDIQWPRQLQTTMHPRTWVISDSWFRGRRTSHRWFHKAVNYSTLDSSVQMVTSGPRQEFR